ncbi:MAG: hypothetical protein IPM86_03635 [Saprospiraceae bacterium]|nr:hypothetical protein [Saprospiraceae bacterium]
MQFKFLFFALLITSTTLHAQWDPTKKCYIDGGTNDCLSNTILTALPFLRISPDARSGAMGTQVYLSLRTLQPCITMLLDWLLQKKIWDSPSLILPG